MKDLLKLDSAARISPTVTSERERAHLIFNSLTAVTQATEEIRCGDDALASVTAAAAAAAERGPRNELLGISLWHYRRGLAKLTEAIAGLERCRTEFSTVRTRALAGRQIGECRRMMAATRRLIARAESLRAESKPRIRRIARPDVVSSRPSRLAAA